MSVSTYKQNDAMGAGKLDKMTVFQKCMSSFNSSHVSAKDARWNLAKLVHLIYTGETFPPDEATALFFTITKLFQKESPGLRQMTYLAIREMRPFTDNVLMVMAAVMKDVQGATNQVYRPDAIRALASIVDAEHVESIDRLMRMAIVDKNGAVSSAALVSAYHLLPIAKDTVRRWSTEVQEALAAPKTYMSQTEAGTGTDTRAPTSAITQYHALGLLYHMRVHDRMALLKLIQQLSSTAGALRSPQATVMLIRYVSSIIDDDAKLRPTLLQYLVGWLKHRSDMVNLEAAKAILAIPSVTAVEAEPAVDVLRVFLGSPRTASRFSAVRMLNRFAVQRPELVASCNTELESLIADRNQAVAIYAITALLKTGTEDSVQRLVDQISNLVGTIEDDLRLVVVDAIRTLAIKFPSKHDIILKFFESELVDVGGLPLKTAVVDAVTSIMAVNPGSRDAALSQLSEFIEDCEYTELTVRVLHVLGAEGPLATNPTQYVRAIYNRVVLENSLVRAAAVSALTRFALVDDEALQTSVRVLLQRCLADLTDEVRDRAAFSLGVLDVGQPVSVEFLAPATKLSLPNLEDALLDYISDSSNFSKQFSTENVRRVTDEERRAALEAQSTIKAALEEQPPAPVSEAATPAPESSRQALLEAEQQLQEIPEIAEFGKLLHTSAPKALTESEMEYVVHAIVHVFAENLVLQLDVENTFDMILENVVAEIDAEDTGLEEKFMVPIDTLEPNTKGTIYVAFDRQGLALGTVPVRLNFTLKEDADDEGQEEEYGVNDLTISPGDYIVPTYVGSFSHQWDELAAEQTATRQLAGPRTLPEAVDALASFLGLMPVDNTDTVGADATTHTLKLFGRSVDNVPVAVQARLVRTKAGVAGKFAVRSVSQDLVDLISESIDL